MVPRGANKRTEVHWSTAMGTLEHVFCTSDFGITFQKGSGLELVTSADGDYSSKATDWVVMCAGAFVCRFSRTQKCVTLSTKGKNVRHRR